MPVYFASAQPIAPASAKRFTDDFKYISGSGLANRWGTRVVGGGSVAVQGDTASGTNFGTINLRATAVADVGGINSGAIPFPANNFMLFQCSFKLPTLSDGTNRYIVSAGVFDRTNPNIGFTFQYTDNVNGGQWVFLHNGAVAIASSVGIITTARNALLMYATDANGPIVCRINGSLIGSIPAVTQLFNLSACLQIQKTVGAVLRTCLVEYAGVYWMRPDVSV